MAKVLSINPVPRILDERAALYKTPPNRQITMANGSELPEEMKELILAHYKFGKFDQKFKQADWIYELQGQVEMQVIPYDGAITARALHPHQTDVVTDERDPLKAFAYVTSTVQNTQSFAQSGDGRDQKIADRNDGQSGGDRKKMRFVMWSAQHNLLCDGNGDLVGSDDGDIANHLGRLPFEDLTFDRDSAEFWNRTGEPICDFAIEYCLFWSDAMTIGRLQGFGQGVISSKEKPERMDSGPQKYLWLQQEDGSGPQPSFAFVSPNPNLDAMLNMGDKLLNVLQTTEGVDPRTVTSTGEGRSYKSGWDRMLAMVERFDESKDVIDMFTDAEEKVFRLIIEWHNLFAGTKKNNPLRKELQGPALPTDLKFTVTFNQPQVIQSEKELQDAHITMIEAGLESKIQAIMKLNNLDEKQAIAYFEKVAEHEQKLKELMPEPEIDPATQAQVSADENLESADQSEADKEAA